MSVTKGLLARGRADHSTLREKNGGLGDPVSWKIGIYFTYSELRTLADGELSSIVLPQVLPSGIHIPWPGGAIRTESQGLT